MNCPHCGGGTVDNGDGNCLLCGKPLNAQASIAVSELQAQTKPKRKYTRREPKRGRTVGVVGEHDELMKLRGWQEAAREFLKVIGGGDGSCSGS